MSTPVSSSTLSPGGVTTQNGKGDLSNTPLVSIIVIAEMMGKALEKQAVYGSDLLQAGAKAAEKSAQYAQETDDSAQKQVGFNVAMEVVGGISTALAIVTLPLGVITGGAETAALAIPEVLQTGATAVEGGVSLATGVSMAVGQVNTGLAQQEITTSQGSSHVSDEIGSSLLQQMKNASDSAAQVAGDLHQAILDTGKAETLRKN
jgi:hypothetical protein